MKGTNYQVIEIIDTNTLIINYGMANGANRRQKLRIFEKGEPVKDLQGREIGTLDIIKDVVEVVTPYENFSICKKLLTPAVLALNPLSQLLKNSAVSSQLLVDEKAISNRKINPPTPIKLGDWALVLPSDY